MNTTQEQDSTQLVSDEVIDAAVASGDTDAAVSYLISRVMATGGLADCVRIGAILMGAGRHSEARDFLKNIWESNRQPQVLDSILSLFVAYQQVGDGLSFLRSAAYHPQAPADIRVRLLDALCNFELHGEAVQSSLDFIAMHKGDTFAIEHHRNVSEKVLKRGLKAAARIRPALYIAQGHSARRYVLSELGRMAGLDQRATALGAIDTPDGGVIEYSGLLEHKELGGLMTILPYPTAQNRAVLREAAVPKLFMTVRDPRQILYSEMVWFEQFAKMRNEYSMRMMRLKYHPQFYEISRAERLDVLIEKRFPEICGFQLGWHEEYSDPSLPYQFKIFRHEDMKRAPKEFFNGILSFLEAPPETLNQEPRESQRPAGADYGEQVFRLGSNDEWRSEVTPKQLSRINELLPEGLLQRFGWPE